jgi:hypothetical protein
LKVRVPVSRPHHFSSRRHGRPRHHGAALRLYRALRAHRIQDGEDIAGVVGLVLLVVAVYAALAIALEEARRETVLPTGRRGTGADVGHEPGVRPQL